MDIHILDDWFDTLSSLPCFAKLAGHTVTVWTDHCADEEKLANRIKDAEVLVLFRERTQITETLLARLPNLRLISQRGTYPHIDVDACSAKNILLCSAMHGGAPNFAAAEHTWALILASVRQLPQQMQSLQKGQWQIGVGKTLRGRTIGLYGYGRIAKAVAGYAKAFEMKVVWWGSEAGRQSAKDAGEVVANSREEFFSQSDIVSIHVRLKPKTRGLISAADLAQMRADALFVNTSRAALLENNALLHALNNGRPGNAAIDVFDAEPINWTNDTLATHPKIIATPHIGFVTEDEYELQFTDIFEQIIAYHNGSPINVINPLS